MGVAKDERRALAGLFDRLGPEAPTLCAGWKTRDLAAHLAIRERRADAAPGILIGPLAGYSQQVQDRYAARPWPELVELVRLGPPWFWPTAIGALDELVNAAEFLVHHEDVRRAGPNWSPRPPERARDDAAWTALRRTSRLLFRRSPVGLVLRRADEGAGGGGVTEEITLAGQTPVTITGTPVDLLLYGFGRDAVLLGFDGPSEALDGVGRGV